MKFAPGILAMLLVPGLAAAHIESNTSASSVTGGNIVGPGGVVTTGGASASVSTTNISGKSSSSVYIKTDANGVVREESHTSSANDVSVTVQSTPQGTVVETREGSAPAVRRVVPTEPTQMHTEAQADVQAIATSEVAMATSVPQAEASVSLGARIVLSIQNFFAGLFGWLR